MDRKERKQQINEIKKEEMIEKANYNTMLLTAPFLTDPGQRPLNTFPIKLYCVSNAI